MKCVRCGEEIGEARACRWCGAMQPEGRTKEAAEAKEPVAEGDEQIADSEEGAAAEGDDEKNDDKERGGIEEGDAVEKGTSAEADESPGETERKRVGRGRKLAIINGCIAAVLVAFIAFTLATAERWEKVDVPAHEDPLSAREVPTGKYIVTMDSVNPCYVGQDWNDCINAYVAQYNNTCTLPLTERRVLKQRDDGSYTSIANAQSSAHVQTAMFIRLISPRTLCQEYSEMISGMQADARPGSYVASLGSWGQLTATPETKTVYDIVPAQTHEAVCYLGFIGECREDETAEGDQRLRPYSPLHAS